MMNQQSAAQGNPPQQARQPARQENPLQQAFNTFAGAKTLDEMIAVLRQYRFMIKPLIIKGADVIEKQLPAEQGLSGTG